MISIITSIHNQYGMNKLFFETLKANTEIDYELIIIDNNSTDGSKEYFQEHADKLIVNTENFSYPVCQNQGIKEAKYDFLAFFNNDLLVTRDWDKRILSIMKKEKIDVISFATNDHLENVENQKKLNRKWKRIKYLIKFFFGTKYNSLRLMRFLTFGNLNSFADNRFREFGNQIIEGYSGSCILMNRRAIEKVGQWDERLQAADYDLFNRVKERALSENDIKPIQLAVGVYFHHYQRLTERSNYEPFTDRDNLITMKEKWDDKTDILRKDIIG